MNCEQLWLATRYVLVLLLWTGVPAAAMAQHRLAGPGETGASLPILPPKQPPITEPDWRKVPQPKPFIVRPPKGAPNVLIVLLDQTAYADPSTFGGPINFPTLDRLAREGRHVHELPRQQPVLAEPHRIADWAQSTPEQHGRRC